MSRAEQIQAKTTESVKDSFLIDSTIPYYFVMTVYSLFYVGVYFHNQFILMSFIFVVLPYCDTIFSMDLLNPSKEKERELKQRNSEFKLPLYLASLVGLITYFYGIIHLADPNYGILYKIACLICLQTFQAVSINYSHELMHKVNNFDNTLGALLLINNFYTHFFIEHVYGHHKYVATPHDVASAVKGQTVWDFIPKSLFGGFTSSIKIESDIIKEEERNPLTHRVILSFIASIVLIIIYFKVLTFGQTIAAVLIGIGGPLQLEVINYIEHYGLRRKKLDNGEYEVVTIHHSWNAPHRMTNYILFKLQRHSDHHANALKPYQTLCSYDESPNLPSGYAFCIILALFPSSWFDIMNPLVEVYNDKKVIPREVMEKSIAKSDAFLNKVAVVIASLTILQILINAM